MLQGPAKAAAACLGRSLAQTYAKHGINTNTIAPGVIDNGFHAAHTSAENMEKMGARIPQGRFGAPLRNDWRWNCRGGGTTHCQAEDLTALAQVGTRRLGLWRRSWHRRLPRTSSAM